MHVAVGEGETALTVDRKTSCGAWDLCTAFAMDAPIPGTERASPVTATNEYRCRVTLHLPIPSSKTNPFPPVHVSAERRWLPSVSYPAPGTGPGSFQGDRGELSTTATGFRGSTRTGLDAQYVGAVVGARCFGEVQRSIFDKSKVTGGSRVYLNIDYRDDSAHVNVMCNDVVVKRVVTGDGKLTAVVNERSERESEDMSRH